MDRKGQSSILFIVLIPVFLIITAIVVDTGINMYNEKKLKNVTEDVIVSLLEYDLDVNYTNKEDVLRRLNDRAELIYKNNDIDTEYLKVDVLYSERISVSNTNIYYSFMNSLFNKGNGNRQITVEALGYKNDNGEIVVEFEGDTYEN